MKGFRDWYAMKSLESFNQGKGRLIRTVTDRGLISILDVRINDQTSNVYRTAKVGIDASGSYVTQDIGVVKQFMEAAL
jgi:Rad3-related DNA helicase